MTEARLWAGASGYSFKEWKGSFYPPHMKPEDMLAWYAARLPTVEGTWAVANWHEREAYDLFGMVFDGHSDMRRILLPDDWIGHPLRKDWVDPDFYNGMHVKPTPQMAERSMAGEKIGVGPFDFTPPNRHVDE